MKWFTDGLLVSQFFLSEFPVRFQNHSNGLVKVGSGLLQSGSLRIGSGDFLDEGRVAFRKLQENGGQRAVHGEAKCGTVAYGRFSSSTSPW